jgi:putative ABC transport system permease protein
MMIPPRWRKVLADLWGNKIRTLLVVLSIGVGVFAVGMVSSSFIILLSDMEMGYQSVNPHSAIIYCSPFDDDFLASLKEISGVDQVEGRASVSSARVILSSDEKIPIAFMTIPSVDEMVIDRLSFELPVDGAPLGKHEIYIERSAQEALGVEPGDMIQVELANGKIRELGVAAVVHDVSGPPYTFMLQAQAFTTSETLEWLGGSRLYDQVYFTVSENKTDDVYVNDVAQRLANKIEKSGRDVYFTFVFNPGEHFATDVTEALGVIMSILGFMAVILSGFLVINTINALLAQHVVQIGMMKAIGGKSRQLLAMYVVLVFCFGLISLVIAMPLSIYAGYMVAAGVANFLNFDVLGFRVPLLSAVLQVAIAFVVPVTAALFPVSRGTRVTIREAISNYGLGQGQFGSSWIDRIVERVRGLSRPLLLSLRNTFRRKGRLALTLSTLILGGAIFIAVLNLRTSFHVAIENTLGYFLSDVNVSFDRSYRIQQVESLAMSVPGVVGVEGWAQSTAQVLTDDKQTSDEIAIVAPPANSTLIDPTVIEGRWLTPDDENALVIGNHLRKIRPDLAVGDEVVIKIDGEETSWEIVGFYQVAGNVIPPVVYANYEYLSHSLNQIDEVFSLRVITASHDGLAQSQVAKSLESRFQQAGVTITSIATGQEINDQNQVTIDILVYFLMVMAVLIAVVGALGLTGTMSMNVLERTREIGVMRAIGARNMTIQMIVIVEGMFIGIISWIFGSLVSLPISLLLDNVAGVAFVTTPLPFILSADGYIIWLVGIIVLSTAASAIPAYNASRLTVREVLAYE